MDALLTYVLRQGDRALVLAQRLLEEVTHAPEIEEDMALANLALDLIGQARALYTYAGAVEGNGHDEDHFAYWRDQHEFVNPLLVEQPNGDFAHVIVRQFLHDAFALPYWQAMTRSADATLAALAGKSEKETAYHLRHSRAWLLRLGDGTPDSHSRAQAALDHLWRYTGELFERDRVEDELVAAGVAAGFRGQRLTAPSVSASRISSEMPTASAKVGAGGASVGYSEKSSSNNSSRPNQARATARLLSARLPEWSPAPQ